MEIGQQVYAHGRYGRINGLRKDGTVDIACDDGGSLEAVAAADVTVKPLEPTDTIPLRHGRQAPVAAAAAAPSPPTASAVTAGEPSTEPGGGQMPAEPAADAGTPVEQS